MEWGEIKNTATIEQLLGVQAALERAHERQLDRGATVSEVLFFQQTDAMLAKDRAAELPDGAVHKLADEGLGARRVQPACAHTGFDIELFARAQPPTQPVMPP